MTAIKGGSVIYFFHAMLSCNFFLKNINDTDPDVSQVVATLDGVLL
jgi:hypothetical protein